ncbi:MAG: hypothetical protein MMC23_003123 [Stictis urceolatum]|nr:hypothetical protein [Stictis urceolata]
MASPAQFTICAITSLCNHDFKRLISSKELASYSAPGDDQSTAAGLEKITREDLIDCYGRFKTWSENLGALRRGKASLDQRLGPSEIKHEILRLLQQLMRGLNELWTIVSGAREEQTLLRAASPALSDITEDEISDLSDTGTAKYDTLFDVMYVRDKFPWAAENQPLVQRLGKANAQRRQWLSYRRRHREKLGMDESTPTGQERNTGSEQKTWPKDRSLNDDSKSLAEQSQSDVQESALSSTVASRFQQLATIDDDIGTVSDAEYSETSYTATSLADHEQEAVLVPQPPN